jgi:hypothetical protein
MVSEAFEFSAEPVISAVRNAFANMASQPQPPLGPDGQPAEGQANLPAQYMTAAGGPEQLNLNPPPGTM